MNQNIMKRAQLFFYGSGITKCLKSKFEKQYIILLNTKKIFHIFLFDVLVPGEAERCLMRRSDRWS